MRLFSSSSLHLFPAKSSFVPHPEQGYELGSFPTSEEEIWSHITSHSSFIVQVLHQSLPVLRDKSTANRTWTFPALFTLNSYLLWNSVQKMRKDHLTQYLQHIERRKAVRLCLLEDWGQLKIKSLSKRLVFKGVLTGSGVLLGNLKFLLRS